MKPITPRSPHVEATGLKTHLSLTRQEYAFMREEMIKAGTLYKLEKWQRGKFLTLTQQEPQT